MITIRPETPQDYAALGDLHVRAFDYRADEALLVLTLRQRASYDPTLSLVAEIAGEVVGHAFFSPYTIRLLGEDVRTVNLAPLTIIPEHQKQGIGGALLAEGHRLARDKGYVLSCLLGHPTYYPRHGYEVNAFGVASVAPFSLALTGKALSGRAVREADLPALHQLWRHELNAVDFAMLPEQHFLEWFSPNPKVTAQVYEREGQLVGYARYDAQSVKLFLAQDVAAAQHIAHSLWQHYPTLTLPIHPLSASAAAFPPTECQAWEAAMVCPLLPSPYEEYRARIGRGEHPVGMALWATALDVV